MTEQSLAVQVRALAAELRAAIAVADAGDWREDWVDRSVILAWADRMDALARGPQPETLNESRSPDGDGHTDLEAAVSEGGGIRANAAQGQSQTIPPDAGHTTGTEQHRSEWMRQAGSEPADSHFSLARGPQTPWQPIDGDE